MTTPQAQPGLNVQQVVPFFNVMNMEASLRFYLDGLSFMMTKKWTPDGDGKVRWCWLKHGGAALMLQEYRTEGHDSWKPEGKVGVGVSILLYLQRCSGYLSRGDDARHSSDKAFCGKQHVGDFHDRS